MKKFIALLALTLVLVSFVTVSATTVNDGITVAKTTGDAEIVLVGTETGSDGVVTVTLWTGGLEKHANANGTEGYWIGFAVPAPDGAAKMKAALAVTEDALDWDNVALTALEGYVIDDKSGVAFYANAWDEDADGVVTPPKTVAKVQWFDEAEAPLADPVTYKLELTGKLNPTDTVKYNTDGKYTVTHNGEANTMYGFVVVNPLLGEVAYLSSNDIYYIDQKTSDKDGKVTFDNFMLMDKAEDNKVALGYRGKIFIGGDEKNSSATFLGYAGGINGAPGVTVSGTVKDTKNAREATVTLMDATGATVETTTTVSGVYSFDTVAAGTYSIEFKKAASLTFTYTDVVVADELAVGEVDLTSYAGDIDSDGVIAASDFRAMIADFGKSTANTSIKNTNCDIDGDTAVAASDFRVLIANFTRKSESKAF